MKSRSMAGTPFNFRLSAETARLLNEASAKSGLTKTQVVELCVLRHALTIPDLAKSAREALATIAAKNLQAAQGKED